MKKIIRQSVTLTLVWAAFASAGSAAEKQKTNLWDTFICGSIRNAKLVEFKEKLIEMCDLEKPFSFTEGGPWTDTRFTYCCHKRADSKVNKE